MTSNENVAENRDFHLLLDVKIKYFVSQTASSLEDGLATVEKETDFGHLEEVIGFEDFTDAITDIENIRIFDGEKNEIGESVFRKRNIFKSVFDFVLYPAILVALLFSPLSISVILISLSCVAIVSGLFAYTKVSLPTRRRTNVLVSEGSESRFELEVNGLGLLQLLIESEDEETAIIKAKSLLGLVQEVEVGTISLNYFLSLDKLTSIYLTENEIRRSKNLVPPMRRLATFFGWPATTFFQSVGGLVGIGIVELLS